MPPVLMMGFENSRIMNNRVTPYYNKQGKNPQQARQIDDFEKKKEFFVTALDIIKICVKIKLALGGNEC